MYNAGHRFIQTATRYAVVGFNKCYSVFYIIEQNDVSEVTDL